VSGDGENTVEGTIELSVHGDNISNPPLAPPSVRIAFKEQSTIEAARALVDVLGRSACQQGRL
jgi:hypothetical protein